MKANLLYTKIVPTLSKVLTFIFIIYIYKNDYFLSMFLILIIIEITNNYYFRIILNRDIRKIVIAKKKDTLNIICS